MSLAPSSEITIEDTWEQATAAVTLAWSKTTKRIRIAAGAVLLLIFTSFFLNPTIPKRPSLPTITVSYGNKDKLHTQSFNASKVALLIENRPEPILVPILIHFISVVPPDWRFNFMGSTESVAFVNTSVAIQQHVAAGKLDLTYIPANMSTGSQEEISRFLTTLWLYETVLAPAEWLLIFQTDSMLCANSRQTLNHWLDYDWVGAPWSRVARYGGNGGLSLRRVSAIIDVLRNQQREWNSDPEDVWLSDRLGHRPGAKLANGTVSMAFSGENFVGEGAKVTTSLKGAKAAAGKGKQDPSKAGELIKGIDDWREGFYEPMGYHTGSSGRDLHGSIWGTPELRKHLFDYCPEIKMTTKMDAEKYIPGNCGSHWKRDDEFGDTESYGAAETEWIDGVEYPLLPAGLVPW